jgi:hypothetical protein
MAFKGDTADSAARNKAGKRVEVIDGSGVEWERVCQVSVLSVQARGRRSQRSVGSEKCRGIGAVRTSATKGGTKRFGPENQVFAHCYLLIAEEAAGYFFGGGCHGHLPVFGERSFKFSVFLRRRGYEGQVSFQGRPRSGGGEIEIAGGADGGSWEGFAVVEAVGDFVADDGAEVGVGGFFLIAVTATAVVEVRAIADIALVILGPADESVIAVFWFHEQMKKVQFFSVPSSPRL